MEMEMLQWMLARKVRRMRMCGAWGCEEDCARFSEELMVSK